MHKLTGVACYGHVPQLHKQCQTLGFLLREHLTANTILSASEWGRLRLHYHALLDTLSNLAFAVNPPEQLQDFLSDWDARYQQGVDKLPLFKPAITQQWSEVQQQQFVRLFYHARGHFYKFLWLLGNEAPNQADKAIILANIQEEFGEEGLSHEKLYEIFAQTLGVEVRDEFFYDFYHAPYLKEYNLTHLTWLDAQDWQGKSAAFSAYERLDNIDYQHLENLASSLGVKGNGLAFFKVHNKADHFDRTVAMLEKIWANDRQQVNRAFAFIGRHQLNMWTWLSTTLSDNSLLVLHFVSSTAYTKDLLDIRRS
ncbi:MAG: iron-containing redox enzyme family protein [Gammaproteobacteria bacterium]|nr:iron-containing redox enzyme family protein [Gammaproteobacteria bacterium]